MSQSWWSLARSMLFTILFNNVAFKCHFWYFFYLNWMKSKRSSWCSCSCYSTTKSHTKIKKFQITLPVSNSFSDDRLVFVWWFGSPGSEQPSSSRFNSFKFCLMNKSPVSWCCALLCFVHFKVFHMKTGETTF